VATEETPSLNNLGKTSVNLNCANEPSFSNRNSNNSSSSFSSEPSNDQNNDIDKSLNDIQALKGLKIAALNVNSLCKHIDELRIILRNRPLDIFIINESKLDDTIKNELVNIAGYNIIRKDRNRHGGGVAMYIKEELNYSDRNDLVPEDLELLCTEVKFKSSKPLFVCTWYRPPNSEINVLNKYEEFLAKNDGENKETIILGDFNCDHLNETSNDGNTVLLKVLNTIYGFEQLINEPTRTTQTSSTLIDLVLTNHPEKITKSGVVQLGISDHDLIYCVRKINRNLKHGHKEINYRNFKSFDIEIFKECLRQAPWDQFYSCNDANKAWELWKNNFIDALNRHAPIKKKRIKKNSVPWINKEIKRLMHCRDYFKKLHKRTSDPEHWTEYKNFRNKVTAQIRLSKANYYKEKIQDSKGNPRKTWQFINEILSQNKKNSSVLSLKIDDHEITDSETIANIFNQHFSTVGSNLASQIPTGNTSHEEFLDQTSHNFKLSEVTISQVIEILTKVDSRKATGLDGISAHILKASCDVIAPQLAYMFNRSIKTSKFIDEWKVARVTPIHKGGSTSDINNYRPISVLPIISKIFEKLIFNQLYDYLTTNNLLHSDQSGFRPHHSTATCLLKQVDDWLKNMDEGKINGIIQIDLKKAFDTVDHEILVHKLLKLGINDNLFKSYLEHRLQRCSVNNIITSVTNITHGIPQGSVLGPLFFLIYINDLPNCLKHTSASLFADDTQIYAASHNSIELNNKLNEDMHLLLDWVRANKLTLHPKKTKCILIGSRQRLTESSLSLNIDNHVITPDENIKSLGVILDSNLSWDAHIDLLLNKARSSLNALKRSKHFIDQETHINLYNALVTPHLDYCCEVWGNTNKGQTDKLQRIQNRAARIITGATYEIRSKDVLDSLGWQPLKHRRDLSVATLMFKCLNNQSPNYIKEMFKKNCEITSYNLRGSKHSLFIPRFNTEYGKKSFSYRGAKMWNSLPEDTKSKKSLSSFKKALSNV